MVDGQDELVQHAAAPYRRVLEGDGAQPRLGVCVARDAAAAAQRAVEGKLHRRGPAALARRRSCLVEVWVSVAVAGVAALAGVDLHQQPKPSTRGMAAMYASRSQRCCCSGVPVAGAIGRLAPPPPAMVAAPPGGSRRGRLCSLHVSCLSGRARYLPSVAQT